MLLDNAGCKHFTTLKLWRNAIRATKVSADEQYRLIMECRQSGLSDQQWCLNHDINPGTFYNWVKRLRHKGSYDIPAATRRSYKEVPKQEVVKLEFEQKPVSSNSESSAVYTESYQEQNPGMPMMELSLAGACLRITNGIARAGYNAEAFPEGAEGYLQGPILRRILRRADVAFRTTSARILFVLLHWAERTGYSVILPKGQPSVLQSTV